MTTYFGNDNSSYQTQRGIYYQPFVDNGPYASGLRETGQAVGTIIGKVLGKAIGVAAIEGGPAGLILGALGSQVGGVVGGSAGASAGEAAGLYGDHMSTMLHNLSNFIDHLNYDISSYSHDISL